MMEETTENMKPVDNSSASAKSRIQSENPGIKWKSVPHQAASRMSAFILSIISTVHPLLNTFLTFVISIQLTVNWYYVFMHDQFVTEAFAYTSLFICVVVLLSDLIIDEKEAE